MNTMVEMRLATRKQGGSERFSCNLEFWNLMVELGVAFGWKQSGATYVATSIPKAREPKARKRDYRPGAWRDAKLVEAQDAFEWASALSTARGSPHLNNMTKVRLGSKERLGGADTRNPEFDAGFIAAMDELTRFLRKGAFSFAAITSDDAASATALPGRLPGGDRRTMIGDRQEPPRPR